MEDESINSGWFHSNRKSIAVILLLILVPVTFAYGIDVMNRMYRENHPELDPWYEPEYNLTVWIAPEQEEFILHLDFYDSEQDAYSKTNPYHRLGIRVEPGDDERNDLNLFTVPVGKSYLWVKIYFDQDTEEPNLIVRIDVGQKFNGVLVGREISILIEPI